MIGFNHILNTSSIQNPSTASIIPLLRPLPQGGAKFKVGDMLESHFPGYPKLLEIIKSYGYTKSRGDYIYQIRIGITASFYDESEKYFALHGYHIITNQNSTQPTPQTPPPPPTHNGPKFKIGDTLISANYMHSMIVHKSYGYSVVRGDYVYDLEDDSGFPFPDMRESDLTSQGFYVHTGPSLNPAVPPFKLVLPKFTVGEDVVYIPSGLIYEIVSFRYDLNKGEYIYKLEHKGITYGDVVESDLKLALTNQAINKAVNKAAQTPPSPPLKTPIFSQGWAVDTANPNVLSQCQIVISIVLGKEFLYCRTHDDEADCVSYCRKLK